MYLNVINYIVHVEHHVGCTVFVIDLQQAEVTNRVSDFFFFFGDLHRRIQRHQRPHLTK